MRAHPCTLWRCRKMLGSQLTYALSKCAQTSSQDTSWMRVSPAIACQRIQRLHDVGRLAYVVFPLRSQ